MEIETRLRGLGEELREAAEAVRAASGVVPRAGLVLGSGFGELTAAMEEGATLGTEEIPHYPRPGVAGHGGKLTVGKLRGVAVAAASGRKHVYEGEGLVPVLFPVFLFRALGAEAVILTNAAGSGHAEWGIGEVMLIRDHLDSTFHAFTEGTLEAAGASGLGARRERAACPYSGRLRGLAREAAAAAGIVLREGVYVFTAGPFYETAAEVAALRRLGGDAFGMSTAPEALAAAAVGMEAAGLSGLTNHATGIGGEAHSHEAVMRNAGRAVARMSALIAGMVERLGGCTAA